MYMNFKICLLCGEDDFSLTYESNHYPRLGESVLNNEIHYKVIQIFHSIPDKIIYIYLETL